MRVSNRSASAKISFPNRKLKQTLSMGKGAITLELLQNEDISITQSPSSQAPIHAINKLTTINGTSSSPLLTSAHKRHTKSQSLVQLPPKPIKYHRPKTLKDYLTTNVTLTTEGIQTKQTEQATINYSRGDLLLGRAKFLSNINARRLNKVQKPLSEINVQR